jgi:iron complex outermembrane recepter protein
VIGGSAALAAIVLALATPSPSPSPSASPPVIGTVRVATGSAEALHRLPVASSLLTATQLAQSPASTGDAALRTLPGFDRNRSNSAFTNYGQLRVSFSGAGNDRGLVLVDGVPAQDGFGGQIDWAEYPADDLVRAELLRGPGSALYGSGAIGGVLSLDTYGPASDLPAPSAPPSGFLSLSAGTHDAVNAYFRSSAAITKQLSASASFSQSQLQYYDLAPGYQSKIDREAQAQTSMASVRFAYAPSPSLSLDYGFRSAWDYQQEGRTNYDFWRRLAQNDLGITHSTSQSTLTARVYQRGAFVTNRADMYPKSPGSLLYTQYVPTHESGVITGWTVGGEKSTFELRADGRFVGGVSEQLGPTNLLTASGSGTQTLAGIAAEETLHLTRTELVFGLRGDAVDLAHASIQSSKAVTPLAPRVNRALSPRVAARYDLTKELAVRASYGTGFRAPFLNELLRGYQIGAIKYLPNSNLVPERSDSLSAGFDWTSGRDEVSIDGIHTHVNDAIDFRTVSPTEEIRSNFSHTQTDGATLNLLRTIGTCSRVSISGTSQYARITTGTPGELGKQLPYVPKASATVAYDGDVGRIGAGVSVTYSGITYADDLNEQPLGAAVTAGVHAAFPLNGGGALVLSGDNVTNARYLSSIDRYGPPMVISLGFMAPLQETAQPVNSCAT